HHRAMSEYRATHAARSRRVGELRAQTVAARRAGQWRAWLQHCRSRLKHALSAAPKKPRMPGRSEEEVRWSTGAAGEQRVEQILAAALDDGWILINGYRNRNGEVDQLLVSAHGLLAIEIKYMSGIIHCLDGAWTREKVGGRGGLQGQNWPIMDRGGRSPGDQVNSVAGRLQRFLRRRDMDVRIARAVVLAHPNARLGHMEQHGLDLIATCEYLVADVLIAHMTPLPESVDVDALVELIEQDHHFNARKHKQRGRQAGSQRKRKGQ